MLVGLVLLPTAGLLWFTHQNNVNERLAIRQKVTTMYRWQLRTAPDLLDGYWTETVGALGECRRQFPGGPAFSEAVRRGWCDSSVVYDEAGNMMYPMPVSRSAEGMPDEIWRHRAELQGVLDAANDAAKQGDVETAMAVLSAAAMTADDDVRDEYGRSSHATVLLRMLELATEHDNEKAGDLASRVVRLLNNYDTFTMPSSQRQFQMRRVSELFGDPGLFPTLDAEELAAAYLASGSAPPDVGRLTRTRVPGVWHLSVEQGTIVALFLEQHLTVRLEESLGDLLTPPGAKIALLPQGHDAGGAALTLAGLTGTVLDGWRFDVRFPQDGGVDAVAQHRVLVYSWTACVIVIVTVLGGLLTARTVRRQMVLASLKNDLIATVAHELKTPLASSRALVETLLDEEKQGRVDLPEYLGMIARENRRLSRLVDSFLTFSRMERGKMAFDSAPLDMAEVVKEAARTIAGHPAEARCRVEISVEDEPATVSGDRDALVTAVVNLLDNALKYSPVDAPVTVRTAEADGMVTVEVSDRGPGLDQRDRKRVFDRFYQVDRRLSAHRGGCGLGLSIVRFIARGHGGDVTVRSVPGEGSTFVLAIPAGGFREA